MLINKSSESFYNKGIIHYENGEFTLAIDCFKKAVEKNSSNSQYYYNLGLAYVKIGENDSAIDNFKKAISLNPKDADTLQNLGIAYYNKSKFKDAIQAYKNSLAIKPTDADCHDNLGIAYFSINQTLESIECFKKALELDKNNPQIASNIAYAYYINKQYELAKESFLYVISLDENDEEAYFNLGNVYEETNELKLAEKSFKKTLSINPQHGEALKALENLNKREEPSLDTEKYEKKEVSSSEKKAEECFQKALGFLKEKDLEPAFEALKEVVSFKIGYPEAMELLVKTRASLNEAKNLFKQGVSYYSNNNFIKTVDCLQTALNIKPKDIEIKELLEKAQEKMQSLVLEQKQLQKSDTQKGKYNLDEDNIKKAIEENPKEPENHFNLGKIYLKQKNFNRAVDSLRDTLNLNPQHKEAQEFLYNIIKAVNASDEESKLHYKLALAYTEKREYNSAFEEMRKLFDYMPDNPEAKALLSKIMAIVSKTSTNYSDKLSDADFDAEVIRNQKILEIEPKNFEAYYNLGTLYSQRQNYIFAANYFTKAVEINPNHEEAKKSLFDIIKILNA